jgi:alkylhydroperoxidase family enzyme
MTWLRSESAGATPLDRVFGLRPNAYARFTALLDGLNDGGIDPTTLDACAARIDALLRFEPDPTTTLALDEAQRAAVGYAEQYALDPHGLRDSDFEVLHEHFTDAQLATLTLAVAMYDARARFCTALDVPAVEV